MANNTVMDAAFEELETELKKNRASRQRAIDMLEQNLDFCKPSEYDKGMMLQAKMTMLNTFDALLKAQDDSTIKRVKMRLSKKEAENNGEIGKSVVALLKSIRASGEDPEGKTEEVNHDAALQELKKKQEENQEALKLSAGELEMCASKPTTEGDTDIKAPVASSAEDDDE